jgi:alkanesulfonate monooxygenase SsuD/methylene tetrahydromethanopterin reductase-like flavin-dependent oxidoreductase (luciferase family)
VEFGIFTQFDLRSDRTVHDSICEWVDTALEADQMGVDCFWLGEFHFRKFTPLSAPLIVASSIAARTRHMKVGVAVQLLPLANPVRLAEECAMLDHLSGGRFVYGVGRSSFLDSYQGYGVDYGLSRSMFAEALDVLRLAWGDEPFTFEGEYFRFHNVNVVPKPYQRPHPEIRVACESRASFPMMGGMQVPIMIRPLYELADLRSLLDDYEAARTNAGASPHGHITLQNTAYVAETGARAREEARESTLHERQISILQRSGRYADAEAAARGAALAPGQGGEPTYEDIIRRRMYGAPEEVAERLHEYRETLGIDAISLNINPGGQIPHDRVLNSVRLLMEKVAPEFK